MTYESMPQAILLQVILPGYRVVHRRENGGSVVRGMNTLEREL